MPIIKDFPMPRSSYRVRDNTFGKFKAADFTVDDIGSDDQFIVPKNEIITFQGVKYRWSNDDGTILKVEESAPAPAPESPTLPPTMPAVYIKISLTPFEGATKIQL